MPLEKAKFVGGFEHCGDKQLRENTYIEILQPAQPGALCPFDLKGQLHTWSAHLSLARVSAFICEYLSLDHGNLKPHANDEVFLLTLT